MLLAQTALFTMTNHALISNEKNSIDRLIDAFIADQDISQRSKVTYKRALGRFFVWLPSQPDAQSVTRNTILRYKDFLIESGLRPFTCANYMVVVRRFFAWTEGTKQYPNVADGVKAGKRGTLHHHKSSLSHDLIKNLLASIDCSTLQGMRDYALINLLIRTGLRLIEVRRADLADLEEHDNGIDTILWIQGKGRGGKDDFVILTPEAFDPIKKYLRERKAKNPKAPLFGSVSDRNRHERLTVESLSRIIKTRLRQAGIDSRRISAHSLRHTFGVLALKSGASLYDVQLAMRHHSPSTTQVYLGDIERQKRLEASPERSIQKILDHD